MVKLTLPELILSIIPESFLYMLFSYIFANKKINIKKYFISSVVFIITVFLITYLPIDYTFHSITAVALYIPICAIINDLYVYKVVPSIMILRFTSLIYEWINVFVLVNIFEFSIERIYINSLSKGLFFVPSLILLGLSILLFNICKTKKHKGVSD
ncbi:hypothetical protein [Clostridium sediminicola]|uniref:hypothetical protein n=1 Tax=Clostridium sediminicola TaxID=3114879 RepID=UPI003D17DE70